MVQGTTPTFVLTLTDSSINLSQADHVVFTIEGWGISVSKNETEMTINNNIVTVPLSQEDTIVFENECDAKIQLNWTYPDGSRAASVVKTVRISTNLFKDVIE